MRFMQTWKGARFDPEKNIRYPFFPVEVPGNIQWDYAVFTGIADTLQYSDHVKQLEETETWYWEYRTYLTFTRKESEKLYLVAEGVDYRFDILLDGETLFSQEGMFTPVRLNLTDKAHEGSLLQFIIYPHPHREGVLNGYRQAADASCKPPFSYGWDWNPRLPVSGLWLPSYLETKASDSIISCEPFYELSEDRSCARVHFDTVCENDVPVRYTLRDTDGNTLYDGDSPDFTIENVHLWWCAGQGDPYLYTWSVRTGHDCVQGRLGFRTVRLVQNEGVPNEPRDFPKSRYAAAITVELNGRRIFAKGSNWVNPELFPGRITPQRYRELLETARDANMNILRLWGGSGIKKPEFYELCDELGILVWQEFMLACNNYRGTRRLLSVAEQEVSSIIRSLRHHPCIALWCGGNELFNGWSGMDEQSHVLRLMNKLCYELDFDRPFLMTSPSAGMAHGGYLFQDPTTGEDVLGFFSHQHYTAYTEFGIPSLPDESQLRRIIPEDELFPVRRTDAWVEHHAFDAWGKDSWMCMPILRQYFDEPQSLQEIIADTQWMQSSGYQAIFEEARRQWPYCSMAVNWCFCEPWITAANNALISYPLVKKPALGNVKNALRPVLFSARIPRFLWRAGESFSAEIWLLNDSPEAVHGSVSVSLHIGNWSTLLLRYDFDETAPRSNRLGATVHCVLPDCDVREMTLCLHCEVHPEWDSEYRLRYGDVIKTERLAGQLNI